LLIHGAIIAPTRFFSAFSDKHAVVPQVTRVGASAEGLDLAVGAPLFVCDDRAFFDLA
jgi:hypothetical protein